VELPDGVWMQQPPGQCVGEQPHQVSMFKLGRASVVVDGSFSGRYLSDQRRLKLEELLRRLNFLKPREQPESNAPENILRPEGTFARFPAHAPDGSDITVARRQSLYFTGA
jgi:hypothetical protein